MNIAIERIDKLISEADKIFLDADGENVLVELLEIQKQVEDAIDQAKSILEEKALKLDPNFASIQGDKVKVYYRSYGSKYIIDESNLSKLPKELYNTKVKYEPDSKAIDNYINENEGKIPLGIIEKERTKQISISLKNG